ncbi:lasso peptide biosynthesis PqqD family chaperone [Streptomyces sp. NPDC052020]|uniref:lasso peptide biosynthesis PqqD family chaperone n=1 Tax=Streptomyces sp. NPDC052020 TaxID=3155677 RepID=UPI0034352CA4
MVLLDERTGRYWQLNSTGAIILTALLDGAHPDRIAERLAATRPVTYDRARADVTALLAHLEQHRLVTLS